MDSGLMGGHSGFRTELSGFMSGQNGSGFVERIAAA